MRVGIDLVQVSTVKEALATHRERYLERLFTAREVDDCRIPTGLDAHRLAARFAAKEATMKALRVADEAIPWPSIEVRRHPTGWTELELHGPAAQLAAATGVVSLALSLTHEGGYASAVVVAELGPQPDQDRQ